MAVTTACTFAMVGPLFSSGFGPLLDAPPPLPAAGREPDKYTSPFFGFNYCTDRLGFFGQSLRFDSTQFDSPPIDLILEVMTIISVPLLELLGLLRLLGLVGLLVLLS